MPLQFIKFLVVKHGLNDLELETLQVLDCVHKIIEFFINLRLLFHVRLQLIKVPLSLVAYGFTSLHYFA